jgi:hypothetical protein
MHLSATTSLILDVDGAQFTVDFIRYSQLVIHRVESLKHFLILHHLVLKFILRRHMN